MNIFVAFFLLLLLLEDSTPSASSNFPLIGTYYCLNMGLITLSTFLCLIVVNFHFRGDNRKEVPYWVKKLAIQHGARFLFVNLGEKKEKKSPDDVLLRPTMTGGVGGAGFPIGANMASSMASCGGITSAHNDNNMLAAMTGGISATGTAGMFRGGSHPPGDDRITYTMGGGGAYHQQAQQPYQVQQYAGLHHYPGHPILDTGIYPMEAAGSNYPGVHGVVLGGGDNRKRQTMVVQDYNDGGGSRTTKPVNYNEVDDVLSDCFRLRKRQSGQQYASQQGIPMRFEVDGADPADRQTTRRVNMITKDVSDIVKGLRYLQKKNENKEKINKIVTEWRAVGMVLDRLFFVCYVFTIILSIILYFPKSGNEVTPNDTSTVM